MYVCIHVSMYFMYICMHACISLCVCVCISLYSWPWKHGAFTKVESSSFCVAVLKSRQQEGCLPSCPISSDVVSYKPSGEDLCAEVVTAGFPCQAAAVWDSQACSHIGSQICLQAAAGSVRRRQPAGPGRQQVRLGLAAFPGFRWAPRSVKGSSQEGKGNKPNSAVNNPVEFCRVFFLRGKS